MTGITGTPGTGKSSVGRILRARGYPVTEVTETVGKYVVRRDDERDTLVVDEDRWAAEFGRREGFVIGHLSHLLPCDLVVVLRCAPEVLRERLKERGYDERKVRENCEAEALDVILVETLEIHPAERVLEVDTTRMALAECADVVEGFVRGEIPPSVGKVDWSYYLGGEE
ncbi:MAG: adenylate kinase family protein [Methanolinea sp.]